MKERGKFELKYWQRERKHFKATPPPTGAIASKQAHETTTLNVIGWFKLQPWMWLVALNYNFECNWLI